MVAVRLNLVARGPELSRLDRGLAEVLGGVGRVLFVRGDSGAGKTSLVTEFAARARASHPDLVVAVGRCDPQSGRDDAFLPFREVLQTLTGDASGAAPQDGTAPTDHPHRVRVLSRDTVAALGPSLVGLFIPGGALLANVGLMVARKKSEAGVRRLDEPPTVAVMDAAVDQDQILEQYVQVLRRLGQELPLLVVLDDLQWADTASLALLARIGRRLEGTKILVVGTFRTSDISVRDGADQHPLESVVNELSRQHGKIILDLETGQDGRAFIDAFLDQEPNTLGEDFRSTLHARTGGHPLFTVELVHHLQDHGGIAWRDGRGWMAVGDLDWAEFPARVEGVIGQRLARLSEPLLRSLTIAAVEGETFTAEVVARAQQTDLRSLVRDLSQTLTRGHHLVMAIGSERVGNQRLSRYRFSHVTVQHYLLQHLDEVESGFLHEDVALALEELYGPGNPRTLAPLARHFHLAGVPEKAMEYGERAGDRAAVAYANEDAVRHYTTALEWATDGSDRIRLLTARVAVHSLAGNAVAAEQDICALEELTVHSPDPRARAAVQLLRAGHGDHTGDYAESVAAAEAATAIFGSAGDVAGEARARVILGETFTSTQDYSAARESLSGGLDLARQTGDLALEARALSGLGAVADLTGDRAAGRQRFEQALAIHERGHSTSGVVTELLHLGVNSWRSNDLVDATTRLEEALELAQQIGARRLAGRAQANLGLVWSSRGDLEAGRHHLEQALALNREVGGPYAVARTLGLLGYVSRCLGDYPRSEVLEQEAIDLDRQVGDRQDEGFRLIHLGEVARNTGRDTEAEQIFGRALSLAAEIGDLDMAAGATIGMAALRLEQDATQEALTLATRAYEVSTELADVREQAESLVLMGHALGEVGDWAGARERYEPVLELDAEIMHPAALVGLAQVAVATGSFTEAGARIAPVVGQLLARELPGGAIDVPRLYAQAARVLMELGDDRAQSVRNTGREIVLEQAARFTDPGRRRLFLDGVPAHRELIS